MSRRPAQRVVTRARVQRARMFVLALVSVVVLWELYKLVGPQDGGKMFGLTILSRENDIAMYRAKRSVPGGHAFFSGAGSPSLAI